MSNVKFICSIEAQRLIDDGVRGNGCGAEGTNRLVVLFLTYGFGFDLSKCCKTHDLEYSLPMSIKTEERKEQADKALEYNMRITLDAHKPEGLRKWLINNIPLYCSIYNKYKENAPRLYHAAVVAAGHKAYWG